VKVSFYVDVPPYIGPGYSLFAISSPATGTLPEGYKRVRIEADLPCKLFDEEVEAQTQEIPAP